MVGEPRFTIHTNVKKYLYLLTNAHLGLIQSIPLDVFAIERQVSLPFGNTLFISSRFNLCYFFRITAQSSPVEDEITMDDARGFFGNDEELFGCV
jgi:hypothetical protein